MESILADCTILRVMFGHLSWQWPLLECLVSSPRWQGDPVASFADFGVCLYQIAKMMETATFLIRRGLAGRRSETCGLSAWRRMAEF